MSIQHFILLAFTLFNADVLFAQDSELTPEQEEAIQTVALEINGECPVIAQPAIPDGSSASKDEMVVGQGALKAYIKEGNEYLGCLVSLEEDWGDGISGSQAAVINALYNRMVSNLEASANAFNDQLKIYQDRSGD